MVDSRQKGARGETQVKELLRKYTKLVWERIPSSGALNPIHKLKGDLYIPDVNNKYCVEVKNYKEDHLTSKLLTDKEPKILKWWIQTKSQANLVDKKPLLFFKFDRSKIFVVTNIEPADTAYIYYSKLNIYICKAEEWLLKEEINFINE